MRLFILVVMLGLSSNALCDSRTEAKRLKELAVDAKHHGLFVKSLDYYQEALKVFDSPNLHFDLALVLKELGRNEEAVTEFKVFLASPAGDPRGRPRALAEVAMLDKPPAVVVPVKVETPIAVAPKAVLPAPTTAVASPLVYVPEKHSNHLKPKLATVLVGAGGLVLTVVGAGLLGSAESSYHGLETSCKTRLCGPSEWSTAERNGNAGIGLLAIGGTAVAVDVVLWAVGLKNGWRF